MTTARLVWATPDGDALVAELARVSNPANQGKPGDGLIRYLVKHRHWSPFEMVSACLELNTTRDIGRQVLRHRSFSFQEFSQRYATVDGLEFNPEPREARVRGTTNRQSSLPTDDDSLAAWWLIQQEKVTDVTTKVYRMAIDQGIAPEVARAVLPEGLTPTRMHMAGTLRSWIHYLQLRLRIDTQKEHRDLASRIYVALVESFPTTLQAALSDAV